MLNLGIKIRLLIKFIIIPAKVVIIVNLSNLKEFNKIPVKLLKKTNGIEKESNFK
jgi:hypothetical protein